MLEIIHIYMDSTASSFRTDIELQTISMCVLFCCYSFLFVFNLGKCTNRIMSLVSGSGRMCREVGWEVEVS